MAENLIANSQWAYEEVLHTKSSWITHSKTFSKLDIDIHTKLNLPAAIAACEARENQVYAEYGCKNHAEFVSKVRQGFLDSPQDAFALDQFEYNNFSRHLANLARTQALRATALPQEEYDDWMDSAPQIIDRLPTTKQTAKIKIDTGKVNQKIKKVLKQFGQVFEDGDELELSLDVNDKLFGKIVNAYSGGSFRLGSVSDKKWQEVIRMASEESFSISINDRSVRDFYDVDVTTNIILAKTMKAFPWGFNKNDIKYALNNDPTGLVKRQLDAAYDTLREFFTEDIIRGSSYKLQQAAKKVWLDKFGTTVDAHIGFFEKGNVNELKIGAAGELAGAILFQYLSYSFGNTNTAKQVAKITGDEIGTLGVQGKADLMLFQKYGVQVKNLNLQWRPDTLIDTNTNINRIAEQSGSNAKDIRIFLANYYFNKNFALDHATEFKQFTDSLHDYMYLVYAIAVNDYIEEDTVNFYLIGGKYLVPSSEILASVQKRGKDNIPITIPSNDKAKTDKEYENNYEKYWLSYTATTGTGKTKLYWQPQKDNQKTFDNLVGKSVNNQTISIKSNIDYSYFLDRLQLGDYGLW